MKKYVKYGLIGLITGLLNGLFGSGGGTVVVPAMERFLDFPEHKAHATAIAIILPLTIVSLFFYTRSGYFLWSLVWQTSVGGVVGGLIGALLLKKLKPNVIRKIFGVFMLVAAVRMVFS